MSTTDLCKAPPASAALDQARPVSVRRAEATARPSAGAPTEEWWAPLKTPLEIGLVVLRVVELAILIA